ncbi:MAG: glucose-1-phosphate cytidylyltransferase [Actinobacteria bacterium]|nr:glucose-1-phosphate cytidylyltransferase [Actinomycetota bacterium]
MKTIILCGGKGTRIRDVAANAPKPMIRIGGVPILQHIMSIYGDQGHKDFVLALGYRSWEIKEYFLNFEVATHDLEIRMGDGQRSVSKANGSTPNWRITLAETGLESQTGYRILKVRQYLQGERFMLTYGDGVGDVDLAALLEFHIASGRLATVTAVHPPARFGVLAIDDDGIVSKFAEKPQTSKGRINGGFFVCEPGVLDYIDDDPMCSFEQGPLMRLAADGQLAAFRHDGFWMPMDTYREYVLLNDLWDSGNAPWLQT